jgi:hypothetical protein
MQLVQGFAFAKAVLNLQKISRFQTNEIGTFIEA